MFDASTMDGDGMSWNNCKDSGPNLLPSLTEILLCFRHLCFGYTANITKALLQVGVADVD